MAAKGPDERVNHDSVAKIKPLMFEETNSDGNRPAEIPVKSCVNMQSLRSKRSKISLLSDDRLEIAKAIFLRHISAPNSFVDRYVDIVPASLSLAIRCWKLFKAYALTYGYHARRRKLSASETEKQKSKRDKFIISVLKINSNESNDIGSSVATPAMANCLKYSSTVCKDINTNLRNNARQTSTVKLNYFPDLSSTPVFTNGDPKSEALYNPIMTSYKPNGYFPQFYPREPIMNNNDIDPYHTDSDQNQLTASQGMSMFINTDCYHTVGTFKIPCLSLSVSDHGQREFLNGPCSAFTPLGTGSVPPMLHENKNLMLCMDSKDILNSKSDVNDGFDSNQMGRQRSISFDYEEVFGDLDPSQCLLPTSSEVEPNPFVRNHSLEVFQTDHSFSQSNEDWCLIDIADLNNPIISNSKFS